jgi:probable phosphoglycerate mutase
MKPGRIVLVRHGETAFNRKAGVGASAERIRGWKDVPLDEEGKKQGREIARKLAAEHDVSRVFTSTLSRAKATADDIAEACGTGAPIREHALRPWNLGEFTGELVSEVLPEIKRLSQKAHEDEAAPGGETFRQFLDRFLAFLIEQLAQVKKRAETRVLVAHTRNVQAARAWVAAGAKPDMSYDDKTMNDYAHEIPTGGELVLEAQ